MLLARAEKDSAAIKVLLWIYAVLMVFLNQKHVSCRPWITCLVNMKGSVLVYNERTQEYVLNARIFLLFSLSKKQFSALSLCNNPLYWPGVRDVDSSSVIKLSKLKLRIFLWLLLKMCFEEVVTALLLVLLLVWMRSTRSYCTTLNMNRVYV